MDTTLGLPGFYEERVQSGISPAAVDPWFCPGFPIVSVKEAGKDPGSTDLVLRIRQTQGELPDFDAAHHNPQFTYAPYGLSFWRTTGTGAPAPSMATWLNGAARPATDEPTALGKVQPFMPNLKSDPSLLVDDMQELALAFNTTVTGAEHELRLHTPAAASFDVVEGRVFHKHLGEPRYGLSGTSSRRATLTFPGPPATVYSPTVDNDGDGAGLDCDDRLPGSGSGHATGIKRLGGGGPAYLFSESILTPTSPHSHDLNCDGFVYLP